MSNFTKRLIALVLLLSHLLTSCGRWEVGECGRGEPGGPNGCIAPGKEGHGKYVEDSPGVSLMTLEGFIAAFNRIYPETARILSSPLPQIYFQSDVNTIGNPTLPLRPHVSLNTLQLPPTLSQRPVHLYLPSFDNPNTSLTQQFLSSGAARDVVNNLWGLGRTLTDYSRQTRETERFHEEAADRKIAEMRAQAEQSRGEQAASSRKFAMEEAEREEKSRLAAKEQKEKEKKEKEERLQKLVECRKEVESGTTRAIKPENYFVANSSTANVKRTQESINKLRQRLSVNRGTAELTSEQQGDVKYILQRIDRLSKKLKDNIEDIKYFIEHPSPSVKYNSETLNLATQLLQDLSRQKEELRQLLSTKGVDLGDYEEVRAAEISDDEGPEAYRELEEAINDPTDAVAWVSYIQQQMQQFLDVKSTTTNHAQREEMRQSATQLATRTAEVIAKLESQQRATQEEYFSDTSAYNYRSIEEGVQKWKLLERSINTLQESLDYFCKEFNTCPQPVPVLPVFTIGQLKVVFNALVDLLVPGSEILKAILGTRPMPTTPEEWADLALSAGLDFVPLGKTLKIFIGPVNSIIHNKIKDFIVKLLRKQGRYNVANLPVGRRGNPLNNAYQGINRNIDQIIQGRKFTGHALDQMQNRGILSPTAVIDVINNPASSLPGNQPGTIIYIRDNLKVIANEVGDIITVIWQ